MRLVQVPPRHSTPGSAPCPGVLNGERNHFWPSKIKTSGLDGSGLISSGSAAQPEYLTENFFFIMELSPTRKRSKIITPIAIVLVVLGMGALGLFVYNVYLGGGSEESGAPSGGAPDSEPIAAQEAKEAPAKPVKLVVYHYQLKQRKAGEPVAAMKAPASAEGAEQVVPAVEIERAETALAASQAGVAGDESEEENMSEEGQGYVYVSQLEAPELSEELKKNAEAGQVIPPRYAGKTELVSANAGAMSQLWRRVTGGVKRLFSTPAKVTVPQTPEEIRRSILNERMIRRGIDEKFLKETNAKRLEDASGAPEGGEGPKAQSIRRLDELISEVGARYAKTVDGLQDFAETAETEAEAVAASPESIQKIQQRLDRYATLYLEEKERRAATGTEEAGPADAAATPEIEHQRQLDVSVWMNLFIEGKDIITWLAYNCEQENLKGYVNDLDKIVQSGRTEEASPLQLTDVVLVDAVRVFQQLFGEIKQRVLLGKDSQRGALCRQLMELQAGRETLFEGNTNSQKTAVYLGLLEMVTDFVRITPEDIDSQNAIFALVAESCRKLKEVKTVVAQLQSDTIAAYTEKGEADSPKLAAFLSGCDREYLLLYLTEMAQVNRHLIAAMNDIMRFIADFEHYTRVRLTVEEAKANGQVAVQVEQANEAMTAYDLDLQGTISETIGGIKRGIQVFRNTFVEYFKLASLVDQEVDYGTLLGAEKANDKVVAKGEDGGDGAAADEAATATATD